MSKILLDTNAYTAYLAGDTNILDQLSLAHTTFLSTFVIGELYAGFKGGNREAENISMMLSFINKPRVTVTNATQETSEFFGHIKNLLKQAGTPLPINDIWIAAHAMQSGATMITYDKHFNKIPGIRVWANINT